MAQKLELRRFARDSLYNLIRQGWSIVFALAISILLARGLGKEARGQYTLIILLPELLLTFTSLGIAPATIYFVGHGDFSITRVIKNNTFLSITLSIVSSTIGIILILIASDHLFPNVSRWYLLLSLLSIPISLLLTSLISIFQGMQDFKSFNLIGMASQLLFLVLILIMVWWQNGQLLGALTAYITTNFLTLMLVLGLLWVRYRPSIDLSQILDQRYIRHLFSYGALAHLANIFSFLNYRIDNLILNTLAGSGQVGIYSVAVGMGERFWIPATAISSVLLPRIASLEGQEDTRKLITPIMSRLVFWLSLAMAIIIWPLISWIISLLYSTEFQEAASPFRFLLPGIVFLNTTKILSNDIAGRGKPHINVYQSAIALSFNIVANIILIPKLGASGAALSSTISYSLLAILTIFAYRRITNIPWQELILLQRVDFLRMKSIVTLAFSRTWDKYTHIQ